MTIARTGLILEGGAMRGIFSAGIMDVLMEQEIRFDGIVGVSAGAAFGCNYKSRQIGRVLRYNRRFCRDPRYCSWRSWWKTGDLFGADFCYRQIPDELDLFDRQTYDADPCEFFIVCTDAETGKAHYRSCPVADRECLEWIRASASMPLVSRPVKIGGRTYLDGAIADSVPLRFFEERGYSRNVVILTQPPGFIKKPSKAMFLLRLALRNYPQLLATLELRHKVYNETIAYVEAQAQQGKIFLFRPESELPTGRICHDPELIQRTWEIGRKCAVKQLPALREFLQRN